MRLVVLGAPGAGKGTQASQLAEYYNCPHVSTGETFPPTCVFQFISFFALLYIQISQGRLVPDDITIALVKQRIEEPDCQIGFILDGYPRTVPQAAGLDEILSKKGLSLDAALHLELSEKEIFRRLGNRRVCTKCGANYHLDSLPPKHPGKCDRCGSPLVQRDDDQIDTIKKRLIVYHQQTRPVLDYYEKQSKLLVVNGEGSISSVYNAIINNLETRSLRANDCH